MLGQVNIFLSAGTLLVAFLTSYTGYLIYREKKVTDDNKSRVDLIAKGQESINNALERADKENAKLRETVELQAVEIAKCRAEVSDLRKRLDAR